MRILTVVGLVLLAGPVQADLIDSFAVGAQSVTADPSHPNQGSALNGLDPTQVLDGRRSLTIQGAMSSGSINVTVDTAGAGTLAYTSNSPVYTNVFDGRLIIDHIPGNRFDTFDLSPFANDFYVVDVLSADFGSAGPNFDAEVHVSSIVGSDSTTITFRNSTTPYSVFIPMSDLSGADLTRAFNLRLDIGGLPDDANFVFDNISFTGVPEPSTLLLCSVGGVVCLGHRRRRRRVSGEATNSPLR